MYSQVDILPTRLQEATEFVMNNDRLMYKPFFDAIETFCHNRKVILGGRVGIDILTQRPLSPASFFWELYGGDAFGTAKALAIALSEVHSPHIPTDTVSLRTDIRYKEFTIAVNARMLLKFYSLDSFRGVSLSKIISPISCPAYFTDHQLLCMSRDLQLIAIYRNLYTPAKLAIWVDELAAETIIYNDMRAEVGERTGGAPDDSARGWRKLLVAKLLTGTNNVMLGDGPRLQMISADNIIDIERAVGRIIDRAGSARHKVTNVRHATHIPDDFQITKHTIYVSDGKEQMPVLDVFNSSQYEMIPFVSCGGVKVGNPWVQLRFYIIDMWISRLIGAPSSRRAAILARCDEVRARITIASFQTSDYVGTYIDDFVAKKQLIKEVGDRIPSFYPARSVVVGGADHPGDILVDYRA
jgi:hypothetical protein